MRPSALNDAPLSERMVKGGAYLALRRASGLLIGFGGLLTLSRLIGPAEYGRYAAAAAIVIFIVSIAGLSVDAYLIRRVAAPDDVVYSQALTLVAVTSLAVSALAIALLPAVEAALGSDAYTDPLLALIPTVVLTVAQLPAVASLERALEYRRLAFAEVASQVVFAATAIALAGAGFGVWAAVTAHWLWQAVLVVILYVAAPIRPALASPSELAREVARYGFTYGSATWLSRARMLVNPFLVGRYAGADAVGFVSLAMLFADRLSIFAHVGRRIALAGFSRLREKPQELRSAINESMPVYILLTGPALLSFSVLGPLALAPIFGLDWSPVLEIIRSWPART